jgi:thiamine biosynthesis protein ThiS
LKARHQHDDVNGMKVIVNSQALELPDGSSVADLVTHLGLPATRVAVELNRILVRRAEHAAQRLAEGDGVEVVTLVGGGSPRHACGASPRG